MSAQVKLRAVRRFPIKRRPLGPSSLQMIVQSGVVGRADLHPPAVSQGRLHAVDEIDRDSTKETGMEQGWLSRIVSGRSSQPMVSKRSGVR